MRRVYLDHNATTAMLPEVRAHFRERLDEGLGNPSSVHASGRRARAVLDEARERVAQALQVHEDEIVFTSGGTEAVQLAVLGQVRTRPTPQGLVTTAIEHSAVLGAAERLAREGRSVAYAPVDRAGRVDPEHLLELVRSHPTALVSVQAANNEIGVVPPLAEIARLLVALGPSRPRFHSDGVQAVGRIPLALRAWGIDLASFSAHKVGGPLGVGVLYRRKGVELEPPTAGGSQEYGLRSGTENVAAISAAALAFELTRARQTEYAQRVGELCRSFWRQLQVEIPGSELHGPPIESTDRLPNTLNLALPGLDGRVLVARLDLEGLEASAGSACASGSLEPSHVLVALGYEHERARAGLRLSLGASTTLEDLHIAVDIVRRTFRSQL